MTKEIREAVLDGLSATGSATSAKALDRHALDNRVKLKENNAFVRMNPKNQIGSMDLFTRQMVSKRMRVKSACCRSPNNLLQMELKDFSFSFFFCRLWKVTTQPPVLTSVPKRFMSLDIRRSHSINSHPQFKWQITETAELRFTLQYSPGDPADISHSKSVTSEPRSV